MKNKEKRTWKTPGILRWGRQNESWFGVDRRLTAFALLLHTEIIDAGVHPRDDEEVYFSWIDEALVDRVLKHPSYEERKSALHLSRVLGLSPVVFAIERRRQKRASKK
jgi:hypothetical protein